jgi:hypothetical protein
VHIINPDVPSVPEEVAFPLALLVEAWSPERGEESAAGMRLNAEFGELFDAILGKSDPEEFYRRAAEIVTSYEVGRVRNIPLWSEVVAVEHPEEPWEEGDLDDIVGLEGEADLSVWQTWIFLDTLPFDKQPCSDITVTVCDPGYLGHMVGGMHWSTTHTGRV